MEAREWAKKHGLEFVWQDDGEITDHVKEYDGYDHEPETCEYVALVDEEGNVLDSLSCIDDADDEYRRQVEHDLMEAVAPNETTCGECGRTWFYGTPASRCPWEYDHAPYAEVDDESPRETLAEEAERLLGYWEIHGEDPDVVAKWAMQDLFAVLRHIVDES